MKKITLKLGDILQLDSEINGFINPETNEVIFKGFLKQNLSVILKYELKDLSDFLIKEKTKIEEIRNSFIEKYGEKNENGIMVKMFDEIKNDEGQIISKLFTKNYMDFNSEYSTFLNVEKEIEYPEITKDDLKGIGLTKDDYKVLFMLINKEETI